MPLPTQVHSNGTRDTAPPHLDGQPPQPPQEPPRSHQPMALVGAIGALALAVLALAAILILSGSHDTSRNTASALYHQKLSTALGPLVTDNQALSSALQNIDGSPHTITAAQNATTQAQSALTAARGAVAILTVPASEVPLSQQAQQALTQEGGYLQGVSATLADPIGQSSSSLRSLATNTQAAFVPIASVAPGASTSISGTDNLLDWVSGATASAKATQQPTVINNNTITTLAPSTPTATPAPVNGEGHSVSYCSPGVYVNADTSCPFAENLFTAYYNQYAANNNTFGDYTVSAYSPTTSTTYSDYCEESADGSQIYCSHGTDLVNITTAAISSY